MNPAGMVGVGVPRVGCCWACEVGLEMSATGAAAWAGGSVGVGALAEMAMSASLKVVLMGVKSTKLLRYLTRQSISSQLTDIKRRSV